jgi:hypothetical protein
MGRAKVLFLAICGLGVLTALLAPSRAAAREWECFMYEIGHCVVTPYFNNCWCE